MATKTIHESDWENTENCRFFSIVIPAHNEEKLIEETLSHLKQISYPKNKYEVIVVENGSGDMTYQKSKKHETDNFKIFSLEGKGVSRARNFGISKCSAKLDWCIIMDADTFLKKNFLIELNSFLNKRPDAGYGTATLSPFPSILKSRFWFWYRNWSDPLARILRVIHIVNKELLGKEKYDEELTLTEDIRYGRILSKHGKYFFMKTANVLSSARRYEQKGYLHMFFISIYYGMLPKSVNKKNNWEIIR